MRFVQFSLSSSNLVQFTKSDRAVSALIAGVIFRGSDEIDRKICFEVFVRQGLYQVIIYRRNISILKL